MNEPLDEIERKSEVLCAAILSYAP